MLKRLILTAAFISSTYAAHLPFTDPDFSILANRHDDLVVSKKEVVIKFLAPESPIALYRLTQSDLSDVLSSNDTDILLNAIQSYTNAIMYVKCIHIGLTSYCAARYSITPEQDAELLSQLFWNRLAALVQTLKAIIDLPIQSVDEEVLIYFNNFHSTLINFFERYDPTDSTPFLTSHHSTKLPLVEAFNTAWESLELAPPSNDPVLSDERLIPNDLKMPEFIPPNIRMLSKL